MALFWLLQKNDKQTNKPKNLLREITQQCSKATYHTKWWETSENACDDEPQQNMSTIHWPK